MADKPDKTDTWGAPIHLPVHQYKLHSSETSQAKPAEPAGSAELACPACERRFRVDVAALGPAGRRVRCSRCGHAWQAMPPSPEPAGDPPPEALEAALEQVTPAPEPQGLEAVPDPSSTPAEPDTARPDSDVERQPPARARRRPGAALLILLAFVAVALAGGVLFGRNFVALMVEADRPVAPGRQPAEDLAGLQVREADQPGEADEIPPADQPTQPATPPQTDGSGDIEPAKQDSETPGEEQTEPSEPGDPNENTPAVPEAPPPAEAAPEATAAETTTPEAAIPEPMTPETAAPEAVAPESATVEAASAEAAAPEAATLEAALPETVTPEAAIPEAAALEPPAEAVQEPAPSEPAQEQVPQATEPASESPAEAPAAATGADIGQADATVDTTSVEPSDAPPPTDVPVSEEVIVRAGRHESFVRIVFDWPRDVTYETRRDGDRLVVSFSRPAVFDVTAVEEQLGGYIGPPEISRDLASITFPLADAFEVETFAIDLRIILDFKFSSRQ